MKNLKSTTDFLLEQEELVEEWRAVIGFEGLYEVSNIGRCRSLPREINYQNDFVKRVGNWKGKLLKPTKKEDGYLRYNLSIKGKTTRYYAHRMVALAFVLNLKNKKYVNHIDSVRDNNLMTNLEWVTNSENLLHSYKHGNRIIKFYGQCCVKNPINLTNLISLNDYVVKHRAARCQIVDYANFLNKPISLSFFIACDEDGNVLDEPQLHSRQISFDEWEDYYDNDECEVYKQALSRVIFKGFRVESIKESSYTFKKITNGNLSVAFFNEVSLWGFQDKFKTIEDLVPYNLEMV